MHLKHRTARRLGQITHHQAASIYTGVKVTCIDLTYLLESLGEPSSEKQTGKNGRSLQNGPRSDYLLREPYKEKSPRESKGIQEED